MIFTDLKLGTLLDIRRPWRYTKFSLQHANLINKQVSIIKYLVAAVKTRLLVITEW